MEPSACLSYRGFVIGTEQSSFKKFFGSLPPASGHTALPCPTIPSKSIEGGKCQSKTRFKTRF